MTRPLTVAEVIERLSEFPDYWPTDVFDPPDRGTGLGHNGPVVEIARESERRFDCCCGEC